LLSGTCVIFLCNVSLLFMAAISIRVSIQLILLALVQMACN
jgi:hypothetical protein